MKSDVLQCKEEVVGLSQTPRVEYNHITVQTQLMELHSCFCRRSDWSNDHACIVDYMVPAHTWESICFTIRALQAEIYRQPSSPFRELWCNTPRWSPFTSSTWFQIDTMPPSTLLDSTLSNMKTGRTRLRPYFFTAIPFKTWKRIYWNLQKDVEMESAFLKTLNDREEYTKWN